MWDVNDQTDSVELVESKLFILFCPVTFPVLRFKKFLLSEVHCNYGPDITMWNFCSVCEVGFSLTSGDLKKAVVVVVVVFCLVRNWLLWCDVYITRKKIGHFSELHQLRNLGLKQFCSESQVGVWVKLCLRFEVSNSLPLLNAGRCLQLF